jgi:dipeptidyl aminopeptidase/acylaminoacyl peptidase
VPVWLKLARKEGSYWLRLTRLTAVALAGGLAGGIIAFGLLGSFLYTRALTHPGCAESARTPADVDLDGAYEITYASHDGLPLRAWYLPPRNEVVIILLPGAGGGRDGMLGEGATLARHGYGLLMTELRSCAHPDGQSTLGYLEAVDLTEAVSWVLGQPGVNRIGVLGFSLGGVTAILGAAQDTRIEAVVAQGGFYDLTADILDQGEPAPVWKRLFLRAILFFFRRETGIDARLVSPISVIDRISPRPLLLIYGELEMAPARPFEQLARAGEPKTLWIVPDCRHGGYLQVAPEAWEQRVLSFFDQALGP